MSALYNRHGGRQRRHLNGAEPPERTKLAITMGVCALAVVSVALVVAAGVLGAWGGRL